MIRTTTPFSTSSNKLDSCVLAANAPTCLIEIHPGHPHEAEVIKLLESTRQQVTPCGARWETTTSSIRSAADNASPRSFAGAIRPTLRMNERTSARSLSGLIGLWFTPCAPNSSLMPSSTRRLCQATPSFAQKGLALGSCVPRSSRYLCPLRRTHALARNRHHRTSCHFAARQTWACSSASARATTGFVRTAEVWVQLSF